MTTTTTAAPQAPSAAAPMRPAPRPRQAPPIASPAPHPDPASEAERRTFTLSGPIADTTGNLVTTITLSEPELGHLMLAEHEKSGGEQAAALISQLSGIPKAALRRLKLADLKAFERWMRELREIGGAAYEDDGAGGAVFTLALPIPVEGGKAIDKLRLRTPDLDASIAVEKFKKQHEQTAAMIAALADLTIPVVRRLKIRDVAVIEAWLAPFVTESEAPASPGAT